VNRMKRIHVEPLLRELDMTFNDASLLVQAFTHASYTAEHPSKPHNERLEFLGDAVLELAMSEHLFDRLKECAEGVLTRIRAAHVSEPALSTFAKRLSFDRYLLLGRGANLSGERQRPAILADVFEAFVGALFLDQGFDEVRAFLLKWVFPFVVVDLDALIDAKTRLQEMAQARGGRVKYQLVSDHGPMSEERFCVQVFVDDDQRGEARGRSKKEAEQRAAAIALESESN